MTATLPTLLIASAASLPRLLPLTRSANATTNLGCHCDRCLAVRVVGQTEATASIGARACRYPCHAVGARHQLLGQTQLLRVQHDARHVYTIVRIYFVTEKLISGVRGLCEARCLRDWVRRLSIIHIECACIHRHNQIVIVLLVVNRVADIILLLLVIVTRIFFLVTVLRISVRVGRHLVSRNRWPVADEIILRGVHGVATIIMLIFQSGIARTLYPDNLLFDVWFQLIILRVIVFHISLILHTFLSILRIHLILILTSTDAISFMLWVIPLHESLNLVLRHNTVDAVQSVYNRNLLLSIGITRLLRRLVTLLVALCLISFPLLAFGVFRSLLVLIRVFRLLTPVLARLPSSCWRTIHRVSSTIRCRSTCPFRVVSLTLKLIPLILIILIPQQLNILPIHTLLQFLIPGACPATGALPTRIH